MQSTISRRRVKHEAGTPDASKRSTNTRKTSGTSSIDTKADGGREKKTKKKSTWCSELARVVVHLICVVSLIFGSILLFELQMRQDIEWEKPATQEPQLKQYYGASFITKDFDCSILARRCHMHKTKLRMCFVPAFLCNTMIRPDMFPPDRKNDYYYVNIRHVTSKFDDKGKMQELFEAYHNKIKRPFLLWALKEYSPSFQEPLTNSKGMPRENQLFFIPWEIVDRQTTYKKYLDYVDLNMDDVPDCIQPKVNTDTGRRDWIASMRILPREGRDDVHSNEHSKYNWSRPTSQRKDRFRVDTVPGFSGHFVKGIIEAATAILEHELSHAHRHSHAFTDDLLILVYRHVLLHALRDPLLLIFNEDKWTKSVAPFDPENPLVFSDLDQIMKMTSAGPSISFLFGAHQSNVNTKMPDSLAVTISMAKAKLGGKDFDLNVPIRISNRKTTMEIVSSAQGERPFHANIIIALRAILRLKLYQERTIPDFNDVLHIPMAFFSMQEKKMIFDRYTINTPLRELLCKTVENCATPYDQHTFDWQTRFNGTSAIQSNGANKVILARIDTTQDKRNYAVGY